MKWHEKRELFSSLAASLADLSEIILSKSDGIMIEIMMDHYYESDDNASTWKLFLCNYLSCSFSRLLSIYFLIEEETIQHNISLIDLVHTRNTWNASKWSTAQNITFFCIDPVFKDDRCKMLRFWSHKTIRFVYLIGFPNGLAYITHQRISQQASPLSIIWFESFDTFPRFSVGTLNIVCDEQRHLCYSIAVI